MSERDDVTEVVIYTQHFRITGTIALVRGARLTDYVRETNHFIAVASALVCDRHGVEQFRTDFLDVGKDHIEIILPASMVQPILPGG